LIRWPAARRARHAMIAICVVGTASLSGAQAGGRGDAPGTAPDPRDPRDRHDPRDTGLDLDAHPEGAVVVVGTAEDHDRAVIGAAVAAAARAAGWSLPREPVTKQDADRLFECGDPARPSACVPAAIGGRAIRQIFVFAVDKNQAESGAPMVVLTARLIVTDPQALVVRQRFCVHCADDRLTEAATELVRQLRQELAVRTGRTILDVTSAPTGARITLDGHPIGATDATFNTFPGSHVVIVEKLGYLAETRTVIAEEGKTAAVAVTLLPSAGAAPAARSGHVIAGALVGSGALAVIAGGFLLELGARGGPRDKYRYVGATPAGAVLGIAGAAVCGVGFYLWRRTPASSGPTVGLAPGGGVVAGWAAAF